MEISFPFFKTKSKRIENHSSFFFFTLKLDEVHCHNGGGALLTLANSISFQKTQ